MLKVKLKKQAAGPSPKGASPKRRRRVPPCGCFAFGEIAACGLERSDRGWSLRQGIDRAKARRALWGL